MAERERKGVPEAAPAAQAQPAGETVYTLQELAAAHDKQFGCSQEMVRAALLHAGKNTVTLAEAKRVVEQFRKREVK